MTCIQTHMLGYYSHLRRPESLRPSSIWSWRGAIDLEVLRRALQSLAGRHSALRCQFLMDVTHQYRIAVVDEVRVAIDLHDVQSFPPVEREDEARRLAQSLVGKKFALTGRRCFEFTS